MIETKPTLLDLPAFDRKFWAGTFRFTRLGTGAVGGKAGGLLFMKDLLATAIDPMVYPGVKVDVPTMAVVATGYFDEFIDRNGLKKLPLDELADALLEAA